MNKRIKMITVKNSKGTSVIVIGFILSAAFLPLVRRIRKWAWDLEMKMVSVIEDWTVQLKTLYSYL